jgi:hypothetical protein
MPHRIRGSEPLISRLRYIVGILLLVSFSATTRADSFSFTFASSGSWPTSNPTWEASGTITTVSSNGQNICGDFRFCQVLTSVSGQVNGMSISFDPSFTSEIADNGIGVWESNSIEFFTSNGEGWELNHPTFGQPVPDILAPLGQSGAWGYLTITPLPEPSVFALLMAAILFAGLMVIRLVRS